MFIKFHSQRTVIKNAVHHPNQVDERRYWQFERRLALICPSVPLGWGWSTWCPLIRQIEAALDSSFMNWEYVTFEVQLQCTLRRWILWIHYITTPPACISEYMD